MAVMDEFREEREAIKQAPLQKRLQYFWRYYKLYVIGLIVAIAIIVYLVSAMNKGKEEVLNGVFLNCFTVENDYIHQEFIPDFMEEKKIDPEKYEFTFSTDLSYTCGEDTSADNQIANETMAIFANAKTLDFIISTTDVMQELVDKKYFVDLSVVLSEEQYEIYEPYFIYRESETGEQIPLLIDVSGSEEAAKIFGDAGESKAIGIVLNAPHAELAVEFIETLMAE